MIRVRASWESRNGASRILRALGYVLEEGDRGFYSISLRDEDEKFFIYESGTPACPGVLTYVGGAEEISALNLRNIRRRVEDALRKGDQQKILKCAYFLGVKLQD